MAAQGPLDGFGLRGVVGAGGGAVGGHVGHLVRVQARVGHGQPAIAERLRKREIRPDGQRRGAVGAGDENKLVA